MYVARRGLGPDVTQEITAGSVFFVAELSPASLKNVHALRTSPLRASLQVFLEGEFFEPAAGPVHLIEPF